MLGFVVAVAVWLEILAGASFLIAPGIACRLLFAYPPDGVGIPLARFAGVALIALGIACLPWADPGPHRSAALGLLVFNVEVTALFSFLAFATTFRGVLLWPAVVLHAILAVALLQQFRTRNSLHHSSIF